MPTLLYECAQGDSNSHGGNPPQGPQPCRRGVRSVRCVQIGRCRGLSRKIWTIRDAMDVAMVLQWPCGPVLHRPTFRGTEGQASESCGARLRRPCTAFSDGLE